MWLGDELEGWISKPFDIDRPNHCQRWRLGDEPSIVPTNVITDDEGGQWSLSPRWETSLKECILPRYLTVLKLQNHKITQCGSRTFFRKIDKKLFWVIEATNNASATNSVMNLSHIVYGVADVKALCSILCSSENYQTKSCWGSLNIPPLSYIKLTKTTVSRGLNIAYGKSG